MDTRFWGGGKGQQKCSSLVSGRRNSNHKSTLCVEQIGNNQRKGGAPLYVSGNLHIKVQSELLWIKYRPRGAQKHSVNDPLLGGERSLSKHGVQTAEATVVPPGWAVKPAAKYASTKRKQSKSKKPFNRTCWR